MPPGYLAAAHGGQVLVSDATRSILSADLPEGAHLRALGSYRLKDIPEPERLHQLEAAGLRPSFPPPRALDVRQAHLPQDATSFIGRGPELASVADLLLDHRLVTLTGPGGSGKTRLAIRTAALVAERTADGAYFVALAAVRDGLSMPATIASAIGLPEEPTRPPSEVLGAWLAEREVLLVLDNLEQIDGAAEAVNGLLLEAQRLRVLATSRGPLHVAGEQEFAVPPFAVPATGAERREIEASEAVRLFVDRSRLVRSNFTPGTDELAAIADIARRLDGLPLALELAAARTRLLPVTGIRDRLAHRLDTLASGPSTAPPRQHSLRETIAWSHDLLDEPERVVFRRLAAFVGGWTEEAARAVAGEGSAADVDAALERLADQSLIQVLPGGDEPRLTMLATIGEFAAEQLAASADAEATIRRHAAFYRTLAERAQAASTGPEAPTWLDRLEADLDNLRAAIDRFQARGDLRTALAIAAPLGPFWLQRNHSAEGQRLLVGLVDRALADDEIMGAPEVGEAAVAAATNATWLGDYAMGRRMGGVAAATFRRLGDERGLSLAMSTVGFSNIEVDPAAALDLVEDVVSRSREQRNTREEGQAFLARATAQFALGRLADARASLERSIELSEKAGDWFFALFASTFLARVKLLMGEMRGGVAGYRQVLETSRALDLRLGIASALESFAEVAVWASDVQRAVRLGAVADRIKDELGGGIPPSIGGGLDPLRVGRAALSPEEFAQEEAAGRMMDVDTAITEALAIEAPTTIPPAYLARPETTRAT